jgi:hypothetical protein
VRKQTKGVSLIGIMLWLSILGCSNQNPVLTATQNKAATLTADLPFNPLQGKVITSWTNKQDSTMSTLYGNDVAIHYARTNDQHDYPAGSVLSVVTWKQQEDPRWFGARIPATVWSVEYVVVKSSSDQKPSYSYQAYEGEPLKKMLPEGGPAPNERAIWLLSQRAAVMP